MNWLIGLIVFVLLGAFALVGFVLRLIGAAAEEEEREMREER